METTSQAPLSPGRLVEPTGSWQAERARPRALRPPREAVRPARPELEIVAGEGVPWSSIAAAIDASPADVSPLEAVLAAGLIGEERFYQALAKRLGCAYYQGFPRFSDDLDAVRALQSGVAPLALRDGGAGAVIAPRAAAAGRLIEMAASGRLGPGSFAVTSPQRFAALIRAERPGEVVEDALARLPADYSARTGPTPAQAVFAGALVAAGAALAAASLGVLSAAASVALWLLFVASIAVRSLAAIANGDDSRPPALSDEELPSYTVVAPVYREAAVVTQLVAALDALDYPRAKLDIKLVVEQGDPETLAALVALALPRRYDVIVAPPGGPTTKPRALNIALTETRSDLIVVYDAEDIPAPKQLRLAAARFAADPEIDCLQARLTVRNSRDSWLSGLFALEYAALFDLINPGLCALGLPIALGGTSNHFRVPALIAAGGWDAWNVSEDADLGIRLARCGYRIGALASDTSEEAPYEFRNWFRQRVRWQKGWMQTCIVHSRRPMAFVRDIGPVRAFAAAILIFGAVAGALSWPAFAASTLWRALGPGAGDLSRWREAADVFVYVLSFAGIWSIVLPAMVAARQRRLPLGPAAFAALPLYYLLVSLAAWWAIADLVVRPHFWAKTEHGRARVTPAAPSQGARD